MDDGDEDEEEEDEGDDEEVFAGSDEGDAAENGNARLRGGCLIRIKSMWYLETQLMQLFFRS